MSTQPGAAGVDDAGAGSASSWSGVRASASWAASTAASHDVGERAAGVGGRRPRPRPGSATERIVPSDGCRDAAHGRASASPAARSASSARRRPRPRGR